MLIWVTRKDKGKGTYNGKQKSGGYWESLFFPRSLELSLTVCFSQEIWNLRSDTQTLPLQCSRYDKLDLHKDSCMGVKQILDLTLKKHTQEAVPYDKHQQT